MQSVWTNERTNRLIEAVRKRSVLWDKTHPQHHSPPALRINWKEVAPEVEGIDGKFEKLSYFKSSLIRHRVLGSPNTSPICPVICFLQLG